MAHADDQERAGVCRGGWCLVTGATGFVGSHLVEQLLMHGCRVRALVRQQSNLRWVDTSKVDMVSGDIEDPLTLVPALKDVSYVFHLAGVIKARDRDSYIRINAGGTESLLEACARLQVPPKRIVIVSSQAAGGPSQRDSAVTEADPPHPISFYGESKLEAERVAAGYFDRLSVAIVRPPVIYGPRESDVYQVIRIASKLRIVPLTGPPDTRLSIAYVSDVVMGIILAAETPRAAGQTYYLAGPEVITWGSFADAMEAALSFKVRRLRLPLAAARIVAFFSEIGSAITRKPALFNREKVREIIAPGWVCSIDKAREQLGFAPHVGIRDGLKMTVEWYRKNGWI